MCSLKKIILTLFLAFIFSLGFYLSLLIFNSASLYINLKKNNLNKTIKSSQNLVSLTSFFPEKSSLSQIAKISNQALILAQSSKNTFQAILKNDPQTFKEYFPILKKELPKTFKNLEYLEKLIKTLKPDFIKNKLNNNSKIKFFLETSQIINSNQDQILQLLDYLPNLLGQNEPKRYIFLLQNNMEIRPSGGFIGSYAIADFEKGVLTNLEVQDIYVPDGQVTGFITPPGPIQEAFGHGNWKLRDGNWDPDFEISAKAMQWFLTEGKVKTGDGVVAINLNVFEEALKIIGEINLPDYDSVINSDNLYSIAQYEAERDFFPGSTQKKDFLSALAKNSRYIAQNISPIQIISLGNTIRKHLLSKDIQFYFDDKNIQSFVKNNNWAGKLNFPANPNSNNDYLYLVEANLGANKANCCIKRDLKRKIIEKENFYEIITEITYKNNNPYENPNPPKYWGGNYKNYLRILLPKNISLTNITIDKKNLDKELITKKDRTEFIEYGFFATIEALQTKNIEFTYQLPKTENGNYELFIQKQSGIPPYYLTIDYIKEDKTQQTKKLLDQDLRIKF